MNLAYVLQYDTGQDNYEISGVYSSLKSAMNAVTVEWKQNEELALWEGYHPEGGMWSIEVYPILD